MVNRFLSGVFPAYCCLCGLSSHRDLPLCMPCQASLAPNHHCCRCCALPLAPAIVQGPAHLCANCLLEVAPYERVIAPWLYDEQMAFLMHRWKFKGERRLGRLFAELWLNGEPSPSPVDVIVPVPLHWWRLCQRGFNQAELLCHHLRRQCPPLRKAHLRADLVSRYRATGTQTRLTASLRSQNLAGAFKVRRPCHGLRIAIVDDVMTTGSTVAVLAHALRAAGAKSVEVWCIARTPAPPN